MHSTFTAHRVDGQYRLDNGYLTIDVSSWPDLPIEINGVRPRGNKISVVPGRYVMAVAGDYIALEGNEFTIAGPQDVPALSVRPELTGTGQKLFRAAVSAAVTGCLKSTEIKAGCGLGLSGRAPNGRKIVDGSVKRQLSDAAKTRLAQLEAVPSPVDPTRASAPLSGGAVVTTATRELKSESVGKDNKNKKKKKKKTKACAISGSGTALATPEIDLSSAKLTGTWR